MSGHEGVLLHRVTVDLVLTDREGDESQLVTVDFEGDPPAVTAVGMLHMAIDTILNGPEGDE